MGPARADRPIRARAAASARGSSSADAAEDVATAPPTPITNGTLQPVAVPREEEFLRRGLERDEQDVGRRRADALHDPRLLVRLEVAVAGADEPQARVALLRSSRTARSSTLRPRAQDVDAVARGSPARSRTACIRSMPVTRSGSGWPSTRPAQTTAWPSAVTSWQPRMTRRSSSSCWKRTSLAALIATCWHGLRDAIACSTISTVWSSVTAIDPAAENLRPQLVTLFEVLLAYPIGDCFPQRLSLPVA